MKPYYADDHVTLYHARWEDVPPELLRADVLVTDPPYPNNAGHFDDGVSSARSLLDGWRHPAIVFWSELEHPPVRLPLVAMHVWHRSNVNGRPYEPAYHFAPDGIKRRSEVLRHPAIFDGAGPGCHEYLGHPTQKPVALMRQLLAKVSGTVLDPFSGSGSTLAAAKSTGRRAIGVECVERYCEVAANRLSQEVLGLEVA